MLICGVCDNNINSERDKAIKCDNCKMNAHSSCTGLSRTEVQCLLAKDKQISYHCTSCKNQRLEIYELKQLILNLTTEVEQLKNKQSNSSLTELDCEITEDIIAEILDRQNRAKNIVILNIKEPIGNSRSERSLLDKNSVEKVLSNFEINIENLNFFRLGKYVENKHRPIKVILKSKEDALSVLKNKHKINVPGILIFGDQTLNQQKYFKKVKEQLHQLIRNGEVNKAIKYINGKPCIVDKNSLKIKN